MDKYPNNIFGFLYKSSVAQRISPAGTPNPASSTYRKAVPAPTRAATFCAGSSKGSCRRVKKERRHKAEAAQANRLATIVMWVPEIEIKWLTPVRLNTCQSD